MKTDLQRRDEEVVKLEEDMKRKEERWEKEKVEISTLVRKAIEKITEALANNNHR